MVLIQQRGTLIWPDVVLGSGRLTLSPHPVKHSCMPVSLHVKSRKWCTVTHVETARPCFSPGWPVIIKTAMWQPV